MALPLDHHQSSVAGMKAERRKLCQKRILLVEDQPAVRGAIALLLGLDEHTVAEATNGVEGFALFKPGRFDLVITDFDMPHMKGDELARRVKQTSPLQPILMITAYAEHLGASDNPVDAILNKPFQLDDLRQAMAQLLA